MDTSVFEDVVQRHSLCPNDYLYNSNALAGEVGEIANIVKKIRMATIKPEWVTDNEVEMRMPQIPDFQERLNDELGDALFYLIRVALDNNTTLRELICNQERKLKGQTIKYNRNFLK